MIGAGTVPVRVHPSKSPAASTRRLWRRVLYALVPPAVRAATRAEYTRPPASPVTVWVSTLSRSKFCPPAEKFASRASWRRYPISPLVAVGGLQVATRCPELFCVQPVRVGAGSPTLVDSEPDQGLQP